MSNTRHQKIDLGQPTIYQIRLIGHLGRQWTDWFGGLTITQEDNGETLITGPVADQSALFGLLRKVRDVGMPLISVIRMEPDRENMSAEEQDLETHDVFDTHHQ
jgi:hypothetical protein